MKILILSCNTGNYDNYHVLKLPNKEKFNWNYYSYKLNIKNNWVNCNINDINLQFNNINSLNSVNSNNIYTKNRMITKFIKMQHHHFIKENYDYFIWIDASFSLSNNNFVDDILKLINENLDKDIILLNYHYQDGLNIKGEAKRCLKWKKDSCKNQLFTKQIKLFESEGYVDNKLYSGGFFIRKNNKKVNEAFDEWYDLNQKYCYRDQTNLPYIIWKHQCKIHAINQNIQNSKLLGIKKAIKRNDHKMNTKDNKLIILIPATPRSLLHKDSCIEFIKFLQNEISISNLFSQIIINVNLDIPKINLLEKDINDTLKQFEELKNTQTKVNINVSYEPSFTKAWSHLIKQTRKQIIKKNNDIVFWFEDDWKFNFEQYKDLFIKNFINFYYDNVQFLLCVNDIPSGPPYFFKKWFLYRLHEFIEKNKNNNIDPEEIMKELYKKFIKRKNKQNLYPIVQIATREDEMFKDLGTKWREDKNIKKWKMKNNNLKIWSI